ncbi:MAG: carbohydrate binding domain-containing protein, partial [Solirubrobacterales bacterium]
GDETLRTLPPYYADILQGRFNSWLSERYKSNEALAAAWGKNVEPLGQDMADNGRFIAWDEGGNAPAHWNLEQHEGCQVTLSRLQNQARESLQVSVAKFDETQWHLQLSQGGLQLAEGRYYTLSFEAIGQAKRQIGCIVGQAHTPWNNLGLSRTANLATEWQTFEFGFVATDSDDDARISFAFSGDATQFQIARVELHPGGQAGLADGESATAGSVKLFGDNESMARVVDRMIFLAETEKAYFDDMRSFIKKDLACGALVTGTIVFGPLGLYAQSDMDYIDSHSYWQHPTFPGRPWDSNNWLIEQKPMTDYPQQATLFRIAAERLADKPFTLSEYNHPAPLDAQAECVPMIASFAAAQDWDGVWLFDYSSSANPRDHDKMSGFFDIDGNPAKWGFMRAGTAIFRDSNIEPVSGPIYFSIAGVQTKSQDVLPRLAELCLKHNGSLLSIAGEDPKRMLTARYIAAFTGRYNHNDNFRRNPRIDWTTENDTGVYAIQGSGASVYVGHAGRFEKATAGKISVTQPQFVALTMTGLDGQERMQHNRILVTACGRCENVEMQFSADRRTVGRNWGQAPAQIEAVRGTIVLPEGKWVCHALAPDGAPKQQVAVADKDGRGVLAMSPEYGTMWYLLERQTE